MQGHWKAGLKEGFLGAGIFLTALLGVGIAGALEWRWPLLLALVATLSLVGSGLSLGLRLPWEHSFFRRASWVTPAVEIAASAAGLSLAAAFLPQIQAFVCSPQVPWKISIALLGAFATSWPTATASRAPRMKQEIPYMIVAALFRIAPFYGFFHGPGCWARASPLPATEDPWHRSSLPLPACSSRPRPAGHRPAGFGARINKTVVRLPLKATNKHFDLSQKQLRSPKVPRIYGNQQSFSDLRLDRLL